MSTNLNLIQFDAKTLQGLSQPIQTITNEMKKLNEFAQSSGNLVNTYFSNMGDSIKSAAEGIEDTVGIVEIVGDLFESILGDFSFDIGDVFSIFEVIGKHTSKYITEAGDSMKYLAGEVTNSYVEFLSAESALMSYTFRFSDLTEAQFRAADSLSQLENDITQSCKAAASQRDSLTTEDIARLKNSLQYYEAGLYEIFSLEQEKTSIVAQEALKQAEVRNVSSEEYLEIAQRDLATLQEQVNNEKTLLDMQLKQKKELWDLSVEAGILTAEERDNLYQRELTRQEEELSSAQTHLAAVAEAYTTGYSNQIMSDEIMENHTRNFLHEIEGAHSTYLDRVNESNDRRNTDQAAADEVLKEGQREYLRNVSGIWNDLTTYLSEEQVAQIGNLVAFAAQTKIKGGELDDDTRRIVEGIIHSWEGMPEGTQSVISDALEPMLNDMHSSVSDFDGAARDVGGGFLGGLKSIFEMNSPSRATRNIMHNVMVGAELGLEDKRESLLSKAGNIAQSIIKTITKAFDVRSPSRVMRDIFEHVGEGIILGLEETEEDIYSAAARIGHGTIDILEDALDTDLTIGMPALATAGLNAQEALHGAMGILPAVAWSSNTRSSVINQTNHFGSYQNRDGEASVRDLNRKLGQLYQ